MPSEPEQAFAVARLSQIAAEEKVWAVVEAAANAEMNFERVAHRGQIALLSQIAVQEKIWAAVQAKKTLQ